MRSNDMQLNYQNLLKNWFKDQIERTWAYNSHEIEFKKVLDFQNSKNYNSDLF